jgi:hypothetical protein
MLADVKVDSTPENKALRATRETSPAREGAICERTPICVPKEPKLPKPVYSYNGPLVFWFLVSGFWFLCNGI